MTHLELKKFAALHGADLVGIASVDRFDQAPEGHRPQDLVPWAKSVVVCALRLPAGTLDGPATLYHRAMEIVHIELDQLAWKMALYLEESGGRAVPIPSDDPYRHWEPKMSYGRGDLSLKHAAQAAGLGKLGRSSLLITPQFGNRVHLGCVITEMDLQPDSPMNWEPCPADCSVCKDVCPASAIVDDQKVNQALCRKAMLEKLPKGTVIESCRACRRGCPQGKPKLT